MCSHFEKHFFVQDIDWYIQSPQRPAFDPRLVHVEFSLNKLEIRNIFPLVIFCIVPPMLLTRSFTSSTICKLSCWQRRQITHTHTHTHTQCSVILSMLPKTKHNLKKLILSLRLQNFLIFVILLSSYTENYGRILQTMPNSHHKPSVYFIIHLT
jgi:hypothetical protein